MERSPSARSKMIETTSRLLQQQGYHATGLNQILKESNSPKGSLYYYFPKGKEELACQAVQFTRNKVEERIRKGLEGIDDPIQSIQSLIKGIADAVAGGGCDQGVPVAAVALETATTSPAIREACRDAYETWHRVYAQKLLDHGYSQEKAESLSRVINAMIEGAIIICLTRQDNTALHDVVEQIPVLLAR